MRDFPNPEHDPTNEEMKAEILGYLSSGSWLADTVHNDEQDTRTVAQGDHPAFFSEGAAWFDFPEPRILNVGAYFALEGW